MRIAVSLLIALATSANAQDVPQPGSDNARQQQCGVAAMTEYNKADLALMQRGTPSMSVDDLIAQRRLQEDFCLKFIRCVLSDEKSPRFSIAFDNCLRDEALEKYDAVSRDKD
jgi:hypothetical protein